jgi:hypothetical protein
MAAAAPRDRLATGCIKQCSKCKKIFVPNFRSTSAHLCIACTPNLYRLGLKFLKPDKFKKMTCVQCHIEFITTYRGVHASCGECRMHKQDITDRLEQKKPCFYPECANECYISDTYCIAHRTYRVAMCKTAHCITKFYYDSKDIKTSAIRFESSSDCKCDYCGGITNRERYFNIPTAYNDDDLDDVLGSVWEDDWTDTEDEAVDKTIKKKDDIPEGEECKVCMEQQMTHVFAPCGHLCCCVGCKDKIIRANNECPVCRKQIESSFQVYRC